MKSDLVDVGLLLMGLSSWGNSASLECVSVQFPVWSVGSGQVSCHLLCQSSGPWTFCGVTRGMKGEMYWWKRDGALPDLAEVSNNLLS
jgi:hypothetical protein